MKHFLFLFLLLPLTLAAQTLEECQQAAERNFPLIRQYGLIEKTTELTVANIQKGWLPQVTASAQATLQSDVTTWPATIQQMVYDGGAIKSQKAIARE